MIYALHIVGLGAWSTPADAIGISIVIGGPMVLAAMLVVELDPPTATPTDVGHLPV